MGLIPSACRLLIMTHRKVRFQGPVLTLGNQEVWASYEQLKGFFQDLGCPHSEAAIVPHSSELFGTLPEMVERAKDFVHAKTLFEMLGIHEYWDIDKFDRDKPRILHDLNEPVPLELNDKFNLIVDGGTIEHVFDIRQVMESIIRMCRTSGWVVHFSPASNFLDHGFYSISPVFFYDVYGANGFDDFICYIWQVRPDPLHYFDACPYFEYRYGMNFDQMIDPKRQTMIFFAARKILDVHSIRVPTQGLYDPERRSVMIAKPSGMPAENINPRKLLGKWARLFITPLLPLLRYVRNTLFPKYRQLEKI